MTDGASTRPETSNARGPGSHPDLRAWLVWAAGLSPLVFLVHDLEEWLYLDRWPPLPGPLQELTGAPDPAAFGWAVGLLFAIQALAVVALLRRPASRAATLVFALLAAARLANGITHLGRSALAGSYLPGAWTAGIVVVPFAAVLVVATGRRLGIRGPRWALLLAAGAAVQLPVILAALAFGHCAGGL